LGYYKNQKKRALLINQTKTTIMKKISTLMMFVLTAWLFQACNGGSNSKVSDSTASVAKGGASLKDTVKADTTAKMTIVADNDDIKFAAEAASGGMTEVALGKIAEEKGVNPRVKKFGSMMVTDHSKVNDELKALAQSKNIAVPSAPNAGDQQTIDKLSAKSGKDFDDAYVSDMIGDHQHDIKAFEGASKTLKDPDLKAFVIKTLPMLKMHLDAINAVHDSMKK
jgi:putative membrane protein